MSFVPPKAICVIVHPNTSIRTYAPSVLLPTKPGHDSFLYIREVAQAHKSLHPMFDYLLKQPYVEHLQISRDGLRVEATEFYQDKWDLFSQDIVNIMNATVFGGEATVTIRDDAAERQAAEDRERCEVCGHNRHEHSNRQMEEAMRDIESAIREHSDPED